MHFTRKVTDDLTWVGADDRRLACFEGVYGVPEGVSYNSYLLQDEKTVLFDTVDKAVYQTFFENIKYALGGRKLDYLVIHHMEPDHAYTIEALLTRYPEVTIICNAKVQAMLGQFFDLDLTGKIQIVKEGDTFSSGKHSFAFVMAPMVHWPEVMMTYDTTDKVLFSADAFGTFGALNGNIFADEVNFDRDWLDDARRYYINIVGKYGVQVQSLLKKASGLDIAMICPLHGPIWRQDLGYYIDKHVIWSSYKPEERGVLIIYGSIYGHTAAAAEKMASLLAEHGIKGIAMYDASHTHVSQLVSECFRYSHLVLASSTYNAGIFTPIEDLLHDLKAHAWQNRTVAIIENGTWAAQSGKQMRTLLEEMKNITILGEDISLKSAMKESQLEDMKFLADLIAVNLNNE